MTQTVNYKLVFEQCPGALVVLDSKGTILDVNDRLIDWLGYHPDEVRGMNMLKAPYLPKKSKLIVAEQFAARLFGKNVDVYDIDFTTKEGEIRVGRIYGKIVKEEKSGDVIDIVYIEDVTKHIETERELSEHVGHTQSQLDLLSNVSLKLGSSGAFQDRMNFAISELGRTIDVSRVYVFEDFQEGTYTKNTFEWVKEGVEPQMDSLQDLPYDIFPSWNKLLDRDGLINVSDTFKLPKDIHDILAPQDIKAILIFPLLTESGRFGFIGFDETEQHRDWTNEEVGILRTISGIISNAYEAYNARMGLEEKVDELERLNRVMIDRELKMAELKQEIEDLKRGT